MIQNIIVYIILAIVAFLVLRYLWKLFQKPKDDCVTCAGCPLSDACKSKKS